MGASNVSVRRPLKMGALWFFIGVQHVERVEDRFNEWKVNVKIILPTFIHSASAALYC